MRYSDFEKHIHECAATASDSSRRIFALDTLARLHASAADALVAELTPEEYHLAAYLNRNAAHDDPRALTEKLITLDAMMTADPVRAIEFHPDITEWMCALDHWIAYLTSGDSSAIARLAINMVNSIDYAIGGDTEEYSGENMLGAPAMRDEYERQRRLLGASPSSA
jgi:hypothetical protein